MIFEKSCDTENCIKGPFHTKNDNYKVNYNNTYISVHTNTQFCSVYSKCVLQLMLSAALNAWMDSDCLSKSILLVSNNWCLIKKW